YFQRMGEGTGDARIDQSFPATNINDLLKSMTLEDLGGGQVSAVSYDSSDPIEKTLKSFAIDLTSNPGMADLLKQARGERIELLMPPTAALPGKHTGVIVGVEMKMVPAGRDAPPIESPFVNLFTDAGLKSLALDQVQELRFLNPTMDNELKRALETLALSHDTRKKSVSINFKGEGKRSVRVGYVVEHPLWKTSYRLVLDKDKEPFLQGWAIVENTSDEDWSNVRVMLVSGRPISFVMDLYTPLYLGRPRVDLELFASLRPPTHGGAMDARREVAAPPRPGAVMRGGGRSTAPAMGGMGGADMAPGAPAEGNFFADSEKGMNLGQSVTSMASGVDLGDFFAYPIDQPVSITRQKSAMLPIISQRIGGTKVSIYNPSVHAKHPLLGLRLKNSSGLHVMQGPITIYEGNSYAGDARILDIVPGDERLISYAMDLGLEVNPEVKARPQQLTALKIVKGVLEVTQKLEAAQTYAVKNRGEQPRTLVIEQPIKPGWKLTKPDRPTERSRDLYRFQLDVAAGQSTSLEVMEEQLVSSTLAITTLDENALRFYISSGVASPELRQALEKAIQMRTEMARTERQRLELEAQLNSIREDQTRMRANLRELPPTSAAYKRYLEKLDSQEGEIEKLQDSIKKLRLAEEQQRRAFEEFLANLNVK
ncbi:MAG TPA: DUF4139 domain-containing protein, partial [Gemmatales bacterium]|nr:DUF4139 domain-containing protein [Gemmatales bacterium]